MDYVADFETTTDKNDCRVWAWCICEVQNPDNITFGNSMQSFLSYCETNGGTYHFHNLAFDGEFIIWNLFDRGFTYSEKAITKSFKTLISAQGKFYQMSICFEKKSKKKSKTAVFKDSLKKLPMSVANIAKSFMLKMHKLELDYDTYRPIGHLLTPHERDYIRNDVVIVAQALQVQMDKGLTRLTIGADALNQYKDIIGSKWSDLFPVLHVEMDAMIRKAYRGGYTFCNPRYQADDDHQERWIGDGSVYDVNSLYPDVMYHRKLPIGFPVYFRGEYKQNDQYPLYIQFLTCVCDIKDGYLPTLQIKNNPFYCETEYVYNTEGTIELAMTNIDLEVLYEHYDVTVISYNGGYMFRQATGLFCEYIDYWMHIKETTTGGQRQIAKLMLNALYGKFATNPDVTSKIPYIKDDGSVGYRLGEKEMRDPVYTPMGCFITAWARYKTITAAQSVYDRFAYADTDSIHVVGTQPVECIEVHPTKLGAWKHECNFDRAKYVRAKTYIEHVVSVGAYVDDIYTMKKVTPYLDVKCAGMPDHLKEKVTFDNFKRGLKLDGKLRPCHVRGGIVFESTTFTLT